jgi:sugar phosphate isomerase/epimerase
MDARVASLRRMMELAAKLKLRQLAVRTGRVPDDEKSAEYSRLVEILRDLTQTGTHLGVTLCLTPSEDAPQTIQKLCQSIDTGLVAVDFDPAGAAMSRRNPVSMLRDLHEHVQHVQLRDGRCDVDGVGIEVPLGRGQVKWDELLALLDEMRYTQWCTVRRTQGDDHLGESQQAIKSIRRLAMGM